MLCAVVFTLGATVSGFRAKSEWCRHKVAGHL